MLPVPEIAIRLLLAAALGAVIGYDRERHTWAAGLRTHMLVCLGSALVMVVSAYAFSDILGQYPRVVLDPSRIAAQVVSGIGFLGAGTIMFMQRENVVRGLTTAAGLWTVAAIGLAVGGGMCVAGGSAAAGGGVTRAARRPWGRRSGGPKPRPRVGMGSAGRASRAASEQVRAARDPPASPIAPRHIPDDGDEVSLEFARGFERNRLGELADALRSLPGVQSVSLDVTSRGS